jgi:hypothetical protein
MKDFCVVIQGPTFCENVQEHKKIWKDISIIFSTWEGSNKNCYSDDDLIIYNKIPDNHGIKNLNLQKISSLNGFLFAKKNGFKRVLKWRQDLIPSNPTKLINLFKEECLNFYTYYNHEDGYVCDYFIEGSVDDMISLFEEIKLNVLYPEHAITKSIFKLGYEHKINFIYENITRECDIFWKSKDIYLSQHKNTSVMLNFIKNKL